MQGLAHRLQACAGCALLLSFLHSFGSRAQQPPPSPLLILPGVVVAGAPATLAVLSQGRPAPGVTVELEGSGQAMTDANGHAHIEVPTGHVVLTARIGDSVATATVLSPEAIRATDHPEVERVPRLLAVADRATIRGRGFDGKAEANRVLLGSASAYVLAASPLALVIAPPADAPPGATELRVETQGKASNPRSVTLIALRIDAPARLMRGEKVRPRVLVEGTRERVRLVVINLSPNVLRLDGGNEQRLITSGGGPNTVALKARALEAGSFSLSTRVVSAAAGEPDTEYARLLLDRARQLTDNSLIQDRIAWMLVQLNRQPVRVSAISREINHVLGSFPLTVPLGKTLEAARDALEGH